MLPYTYRVTKYDPADRDGYGRYTGIEHSESDRGPVEAGYLSAVAAFARDSGSTEVSIREPGVGGPVESGPAATAAGHGLAGLFPPDLTGYHDGARVPVATALELVRAMLRDSGAWCRLEDEGRFFVHVGYDQYVYVGSTDPCERALAHTRELGLFPEAMVGSPYAPNLDAPAPRVADAGFWAETAALVAARGAVILEEGYLASTSRWHRLTTATLDPIRARLAPRARLLVWPDLSPDVAGVLASVTGDDLFRLVWETGTRHLAALVARGEDPDLARTLTGARAAMALSLDPAESAPLLSAVLPDPDATLRARWTP
ncbi:RNA-binding protein [Embleya sp. NPDC059259]|uniref:RNA-binding protein n=1 Tax=unclassified Embleya TaxID=2699296 RepID=UPI0036C1E4F7